MVFVELHEAQLFKLLSSFFGRDRVVPRMSVLAVCGGELPSTNGMPKPELTTWAKASKCLFTIVDDDDTPKMVVEFFSGFTDTVDPVEEEHQRLLTSILPAAGVRYITISNAEFSELLDPRGNLDFFSLLEAKVMPA